MASNSNVTSALAGILQDPRISTRFFATLSFASFVLGHHCASHKLSNRRTIEIAKLTHRGGHLLPPNSYRIELPSSFLSLAHQPPFFWSKSLERSEKGAPYARGVILLLIRMVMMGTMVMGMVMMVGFFLSFLAVPLNQPMLYSTHHHNDPSPFYVTLLYSTLLYPTPLYPTLSTILLSTLTILRFIHAPCHLVTAW